MYVVSILFKGSDLALAQHFKAFKNADEFYKKITSADCPSPIVNEDDFFSKILIIRDQVSAISFTDVEKDLDRNGQIQILQQRAQLRTQNLANNDATSKILKTASSISIAQ